MKYLILFLFIFNSHFLFAQQDTTGAWFKNIDTLSYKVYFSKMYVPAQIISAIDMKKKFIAGPNGKFSSGCTGKGKKLRLNWVAKNEKGHFVVSISYGGIVSGTYYYFVESNNGELNLIRLNISGGANSFSAVVKKIHAGNYRISGNYR